MTKKNPFILEHNNKSHKGVLSRKRQESRFRFYGYFSIFLSVMFLTVLLYSIISKGYTAFYSHEILITIDLSSYHNHSTKKELFLEKVNFQKLTKDSIKRSYPKATKRKDVFDLFDLYSRNASYEVEDFITNLIRTDKISDYKYNDFKIDVWVTASSLLDIYLKSNGEENSSKINDFQKGFIKKMNNSNKIKLGVNTNFLSLGDSREAEMAGIWGSLKGSLFLIFVCMITSLPIGIAAAIYLEEYAPKNKIRLITEVLINNLAAIPSIVYGLLGLALFINFAGLQRSSALVGGLTLSLLILPVIIVSSRNALSGVPPSIRQAAIGLGASRTQIVFHHVLPLALPGIITGTILSMARALGETAPLLMIGMVAFIKDVPHAITDVATVLPVQIYIWSDLPEKGFSEKASAAIMVLIAFLIIINSLAVYLRKKFEYKW